MYWLQKRYKSRSIDNLSSDATADFKLLFFFSLYPEKHSQNIIGLTHILLKDLSSPEPRVHKVSLKCGTASVRGWVRMFTLSNSNTSETSGPITINFLSKALLWWGKGSIRF